MNENNNKKNEITPVDRAKAITTFYKFGRKYPTIWRQVQAKISFHDFFDVNEILSNKLDFSDADKVNEWVDLALKDLSAARKLYKSEDGLALYHLQQGIEKLLKASLIFTGFKTESNVITLNHKPQEFAVELLNDPEMSKAMFEQFPFKGVKKPKKPSEEKIKEFKSLIVSNNKIQAIEKGDDIVKGVSSILGKPNPILFEPDEFSFMTKSVMEKTIPKKELKRFIDECNNGPISYDDMIYHTSNFCFVAINMSLILLPLSTGIWAFQSIPRYPDELRQLKDKGFEDYELHKAFYTILNQVEKFGEFFREYMNS